MLHGKMLACEKQRIMHDFAQNKTKMLATTTVIEVGVDVPNASVMLIENADRFGLAQIASTEGSDRAGHTSSLLHTHDGTGVVEGRKKRIQIMEKTRDGFVIAEEDMKIRGAGNIMGTEQSGVPEKQFFSLFEDQALVNASIESARETRQEDPEWRLEKTKDCGNGLSAPLQNGATSAKKGW